MSRKKVKMFVFLTECKQRAVWTKMISLDIYCGQRKWGKKKKNVKINIGIAFILLKKILT